MSRLFRLVVLSALLAVALSAPVIDEDEIAVLSQSQPCRGSRAGTRLRHPTNDHKYLRCVGPESFWIETCPDNLFFNQDLDLCDWNTFSETTTAVNDIVKFHAVLFANNKTVQEPVQEFVRQPVQVVDKTKLPIRVVSAHVRDDTDIAEVRQVPVVVEEEEVPEIVAPVRRVTTPIITTTTTVRPVVRVDEADDEEPVRVSKIETVKPVQVVEEEEEERVKQPVRVVTPVPVIVSKPSVVPATVVVEEVAAKPVVTPKPAIEVEEVDVVKQTTPVVPPVRRVNVQRPVEVVDTIDLTPKPVKFIARGGLGTRAFGSLSSLVAPKANVFRTDFIQKLVPVVRV